MMNRYDTPGAKSRLFEGAEILAGAQELLLNLWRQRGYRLAEVPTYETYALYEALYGDEVRQRLVTFTTDREYAMRPDLTAGLCRLVAEHIDPEVGLPTPLKLSASGLAYRHEHVRPLRQRMFHQMGVERVGDGPESIVGADVEILSLARAALLCVGLHGGVFRVGHAQLRQRIVSELCPGVSPKRMRRLSTLLDALARLRDRLYPARSGADLLAQAGETLRVEAADHPDVEAFLWELRQTLREPDLPSATPLVLLESLEAMLAEEARGLGLEDRQVDALIGMSWSAESLAEIGETVSAVLPNADEALELALGHLEACRDELSPFVLRFNLGARRWSGFYTGFFFEVDAPVLGPDVSQVLGGGRYDAVMKTLLPEVEPGLRACGFALGLERCLAAAHLLNPEGHLRKALMASEPLLVCYGTQEVDARAALEVAEKLERGGAALCFHPVELVSTEAGEPCPDMLDRLARTPLRPYRQAVWVSGGRLYLVDIGAREWLEVSTSDLLTLCGGVRR